MKKQIAVFCLVLGLFSTLPMTSGTAWAEVQEYQENAIDKMGDWFAVLGKQGVEKDSILAQRKADRLAKHAQKQADQMAKEAQKSGEDMQKKLGL